MQAFIEFFVSLMVVLIAGVLAQIGFDMDAGRTEPREIHRTNDCSEPARTAISTANQDC